MEKNSTFLKILLLGDSGVGKTSILHRYLSGNYDENQESSLGSDYQLKSLILFLRKIKVQFWDIMGFLNLKSFYKYFHFNAESDMNTSVLQNVHGILMICDFKNDNSIRKTLKWKKTIDNFLFLEENRTVPMILVANKSDIYEKDSDFFEKTKVCLEEIADQNDFFKGFLVSAKKNFNINQIFYVLIKEICSKI